MDTQERARQRLADAVKRLMETASLEKITVTQIVEEAGVARQTFYRNFRDKYDLVNWHFEQLAQRSFKLMGVSLTLREALIRKFEFLRQEKTFFTQAFRTSGCNSVEAYDYECILGFYSAVLQKKLYCRELPGDVRFLLELYCSGSIRMTVEWVEQGMARPIPELADLLIQAMPERLRGLLSELQEPVNESGFLPEK